MKKELEIIIGKQKELSDMVEDRNSLFANIESKRKEIDNLITELVKIYTNGHVN